MKCPKCSYVSHDYLNACRKCRVDLLGFKAQMQLHVVHAGNIDLRSVLNGVQTSQLDSGEYVDPLFESPMLVESHPEDGFDINLDDDFSFTPSGVSLESLDGFELSHTEALGLGRRQATTPDNSESEAPETGYATVMMDISGLSNAGSPPESHDDRLDAPIEPAETMAPPNLAANESRSGLELTSDIDSKLAEFQQAPSDMKKINSLQNETLSGDTVFPAPDELEANASWHWSKPEQRGGTEAFSDESEELTLPSLDVDFSTTESASLGSSASDAHEEPFTMPELPDLDIEEQSVHPISEEFSLDINTLATPEPTPMEFPSLQTSISPMPMPKEETWIDNPSGHAPTTPRATASTESPKPDTAFFTVAKDEPPRANDSLSSPPAESSTESDAATSSKTSNTTFELDISDIQSPDEPDWPDLPESSDVLMTTSPDEVTIVDEPSPFASTGHQPRYSTGSSNDPTIIVDELSPLASTSHPPVDPTIASPEEDQSAEDADDHLAPKSRFPNEPPSKKRD